MGSDPGPVARVDIAAFGLDTRLVHGLVPLAQTLAGSLSTAHDSLASNQSLLANELTLDVTGLLDGSHQEFATAATPGATSVDTADLLAAQQGYAQLRDQLGAFHAFLSPDAFDDHPPTFTPPGVYGNPNSGAPDPGAPQV